METRTKELETEVRAATAQTMTQGQQISDIQWKLEDVENRQRRNNLRIWGIAEDLEGQDTRAYIASLFKKAFPDPIGWYWEKEIQRAHRLPLMRKKQALTPTGRDQSYPRAIIVYFGTHVHASVCSCHLLHLSIPRKLHMNAKDGRCENLSIDVRFTLNLS
ncbi:hypothetical protein NDU88_004306 [Pleurodeles waltl]|uniref:Uncharacterized protein n=1 Tax=Pleurodeles waltl TaxID=8319 RepID=A0AAV7VGP6_PLEWA|nr:hypothetical protein NDU88_004306 [Pleurodeles waltl]